MKTNGKRSLILAVGFNLAFLLFTVLVQTVDVQPVGVNQTRIGFATLNTWFHEVVGVNFLLYTITDWLGLVPVGLCLVFAVIGIVQLVERKSIFKVDFDILLLGIYYVTVIGCYLLFEQIPINYRPVLIDGVMEASYPSSTTLLVLSVMFSTAFQVRKRIKNSSVQTILRVLIGAFCLFMVLGRVIAGVHWITDIIGSVFLSCGLFYSYKWAVLFCCKK